MAVRLCIITDFFDTILNMHGGLGDKPTIFKTFYKQPGIMYSYPDKNSMYIDRMSFLDKYPKSYKEPLSDAIVDIKDTMNFINHVLQNNSLVLTCRLSKNGSEGFQIRLKDADKMSVLLLYDLWREIKEEVVNYYTQTQQPNINAKDCYGWDKQSTVDTEIKKEKGEKKVKDFSVTNLKDALVNKITSLDKKTITILAIIALLLLIVGKYQDIKDIAKGIKDKVTRSKNFKAMVTDANNALAGLKKVIGIKDKGTDNE